MRCSLKPKNRKNILLLPKGKMSLKKWLIYKLLFKRRNKIKLANDREKRKMLGKS